MGICAAPTIYSGVEELMAILLIDDNIPPKQRLPIPKKEITNMHLRRLVLLASIMALSACSKYPESIQISDLSSLRGNAGAEYTLYAVDEADLKQIGALEQQLKSETETAFQSFDAMNALAEKLDGGLRNMSPYADYQAEFVRNSQAEVQQIKATVANAQTEVEPLLRVKAKVDEANAKLDELTSKFTAQIEQYQTQFPAAKIAYEQVLKQVDALSYNVRSIRGSSAFYTLDEPVKDCADYLQTHASKRDVAKFPRYVWSDPISVGNHSYCAYFTPGNLSSEQAQQFVTHLTAEQKAVISQYLRAEQLKNKGVRYLEKQVHQVRRDNPELVKQSELLSRREARAIERYQQLVDELPQKLAAVAEKTTDERIKQAYVERYASSIVNSYANQATQNLLADFDSYKAQANGTVETHGEQTFLLMKSVRGRQSYNLFTIPEQQKEVEKLTYALTRRSDSVFQAYHYFEKNGNGKNALAEANAALQGMISG